MSLVPCYRGSVNAWECDENDHLNVRFYLAKANQGLPFVLDAIGLPAAALLKMDAHPRIRAQHVRFLKEARPAVPLTVYAGLVAHQDHQLTLYAEVRHSLNGEVMATLDGEEVTVPAGSMVHCEPGAKRKFESTASPTTLIVVGGTPGRAYEIGPWEK